MTETRQARAERLLKEAHRLLDHDEEENEFFLRGDNREVTSFMVDLEQFVTDVIGPDR